MIAARLLAWWPTARRDLPWRRPGTTPWGVLVSEVMLQQTPVSRVAPVWERWMQRWPTPSALAAEPSGEAVRAWERLGYPRRALRLHAAATAIGAGPFPTDVDDLEALPGVGTYTARAVAAFAHGQRVPVVDVNVRRVVARAVEGVAQGPAAVAKADLLVVEALLPDAEAAVVSAALMELGATVCVAGTPFCEACPLEDLCVWRAKGMPAWTGPVKKSQTWHGTDRQCRGALLAVLRASDRAVPVAALAGVAAVDDAQRARCLDGLVADGLVDPLPGDRYALPGLG